MRLLSPVVEKAGTGDNKTADKKKSGKTSSQEGFLNGRAGTLLRRARVFTATGGLLRFATG
jgi:hypothetical protein